MQKIIGFSPIAQLDFKRDTICDIIYDTTYSIIYDITLSNSYY